MDKIWDFFVFQAFINTAKEIYEKIQEGVFDINNEVTHMTRKHILCLLLQLKSNWVKRTSCCVTLKSIMHGLVGGFRNYIYKLFPGR